MTLRTAVTPVAVPRWQPAWPDSVRVLIVASVPVVAMTDGLVGFAVMFLVLGGSVIPIALTAHPGFDAALCLTMLGAAWAALLDGYARFAWLDVVVHTVLTGLLAGLVALLVHRVGLLSTALTATVRRASAATVSFVAGIALATLWEVGEWLGHTFLDSRIQVGYDDTMTDLIAGTAGAAVAAVAAAFVLVHPGRDHR